MKMEMLCCVFGIAVVLAAQHIKATQVYERCFQPTNVCLRYHTQLENAPRTTDDADKLCREDGAALLELWDQSIAADLISFLIELKLNLSIPVKFFINARRLPQFNQWRWTVGDELIAATDLPSGISTSSNASYVYVTKDVNNEIIFREGFWRDTNGFICMNTGNSHSMQQNCIFDIKTCYITFNDRSYWSDANRNCKQVAMGLASAEGGSLQTFQETLGRIVRDTERLWIGLTKNYWIWRSSGLLINQNKIPWSWDTESNDCLLKVEDMTIEASSPGIPWGVVCWKDGRPSSQLSHSPSQEDTTLHPALLPVTHLSSFSMASSSPQASSSSLPGSSSPQASSSPPASSSPLTSSLWSQLVHYPISLPYTSSSSLPHTPPPPPSSSSSSLLTSMTLSSTQPSSSSSSLLLTSMTLSSTQPSSSSPPSLVTSSHQINAQEPPYKNLIEAGTIVAIVLGVCLAVVIILVITIVLVRQRRKNSRLKESETEDEFRFSTRPASSWDSLEGKRKRTDLESPSFEDSHLDFTTFSTKILNAITSRATDVPMTQAATPSPSAATTLTLPAASSDYFSDGQEWSYT